MNISDEAVEAAVKALVADYASIRVVARRVLEAAAPYLAAQALEDAAQVAADGGVPAYDSDEWAGWLRERADSYRTRSEP